MRRAALWLLALALAGCGRSPAVQFYALTPAVGAAPLAGAPRDLALLVGPVELPRFLERPELVTREDENRLVYDPVHRWGGDLEDELLRVLAADLGTLLGTSRVFVYPNEPALPLDYRVRLAVDDLTGTAGEAVTLRVQWSVAPGAGGAPLAVEETRLREPWPSDAPADLVAAHDEVVSALAVEIARRIVRLERRAPR